MLQSPARRTFALRSSALRRLMRCGLRQRSKQKMGGGFGRLLLHFSGAPAFRQGACISAGHPCFIQCICSSCLQNRPLRCMLFRADSESVFAANRKNKGSFESIAGTRAASGSHVPRAQKGQMTLEAFDHTARRPGLRARFPDGKGLEGGPVLIGADRRTGGEQFLRLPAGTGKGYRVLHAGKNGAHCRGMPLAAGICGADPKAGRAEKKDDRLGLAAAGLDAGAAIFPARRVASVGGAAGGSCQRGVRLGERTL